MQRREEKRKGEKMREREVLEKRRRGDHEAAKPQQK
jgi:hypothetical protein